MSLPLIAFLVLVLLAGGYLLYGSFIARQFRLDDERVTPAAARDDGVDFVPTRPFYLLGQHFSAIAAAGPIVGPVAACLAFGWLPCLIWIVLGVILIGAVHDFSALVASVRHGAHSIADVAREHLGRRASLALVAFIWLALLYVIVSFTDVTAATFLGRAEEFAGLPPGVRFNPGAAVAAASVLYLLLALVMGLVERFLRPPMWLTTAIFVPATIGAIWAGTQIAQTDATGALHPLAGALFDHPARFWYVAILVYCFVASMLPMWLLQQPRGYLGGFVLYLAIAVGVVGVFFGGFQIVQPPVAWEKLGSWRTFLGGGADAPSPTTLLFPFLFVTIACGACSGFHGLVCGGTTSRQVAKESHCKPIAFGAMLLEGFVAVIALATVMIATNADAKAPPSVVYGNGLARFLTVILGDDALLFAKTFGSMAVATFIFDTLDVATRLGRYLLTELVAREDGRGAHGPVGSELGRRAFGAGAAALTAFVPLGILLATPANSWRTFWTLFGTSNQLLASLTLVGVTVWLYRTGRRCWYTFLPMVFVMAVTLTALGAQVLVGARAATAGRWRVEGGSVNPAVLNAAVGAALLGLAIVFLIEAARATLAARPLRARSASDGLPAREAH